MGKKHIGGSNGVAQLSTLDK